MSVMKSEVCNLSKGQPDRNGSVRGFQSGVSILTAIAKTQPKGRSILWSFEKPANTCLLKHYSERPKLGISLHVHQQRMDKGSGIYTQWDFI